jgi:hypothetical protein
MRRSRVNQGAGNDAPTHERWTPTTVGGATTIYTAVSALPSAKVRSVTTGRRGGALGGIGSTLERGNHFAETSRSRKELEGWC